MAELLDELRPVSIAIAYRMLSSVSEAEDIVQEARRPDRRDATGETLRVE